MKSLFIITARGGSKGLPNKNIKLLGGRPLIYYSIDIAKQFIPDEQICVSTDSEEIIKIVENYPLSVPFKRPQELATDTASSFDVIIHALEFYKKRGLHPENVVLLQPTSPFRRKEDIDNALKKYTENIDMVISVFETEANPYYLLFEEDNDGLLKQSKESNLTRRQDTPQVYQANGAVYVINPNSLKEYSGFHEFKKRLKVVMPKINSVDIDTPLDWSYAEFLIQQNLLKI